jgi:lactate dehydrogenase-like 2-hydroxyacid dehydrogenase
MIPPKSILQSGQFPAAMQAEINATLETVTVPSAEIQGILTRSNNKLDPALIESLPNLKIIATCGVGYDGIPLEQAKARGIHVTNTPGVLNDAVCELAVGMLLGLLRRLPAADQFVRDGHWEKGLFPLTRSLAGKRVGIVGMGRIGQELVDRLLPFKVSIAYTGPTQKNLPYVFYPTPQTLAEASDILILTCPGGPTTDRMIDRSVFEALGPTGILVNMARGSVVHEPDLITALQSKTIAGAALDVFANEPFVPRSLRTMDNVLLTPHVGSATEETRIAMTRLAVDNLKSFFAAGTLLNPVY